MCVCLCVQTHEGAYIHMGTCTRMFLCRIRVHAGVRVHVGQSTGMLPLRDLDERARGCACTVRVRVDACGVQAYLYVCV